MPSATAHSGKCFCGAVEFSVDGEPMVMGYCHCGSCREWSASPVSAVALWPTDALTVTRGVEHVGSYQRSPNAVRKWCRLCGGHLFVDLPSAQMVDVLPDAMRSLAFVPTMHVHYQETVLPVTDGLPKFRDLPEEASGSGDLLPE